MRSGTHIVRRGLLAAILTLSALVQLAHAETSAVYSGVDGSIIVQGLGDRDRIALKSEPARAKLQVAGLEAQRGTPVTIAEDDGAVLITPRFALRAGTIYNLRLDVGDTALSFDIALPAENAPVPELTGFAPSQAVIPANTLRLYLTFSEPMARGNLRDAIILLRSDGTEVSSPFLTLGPELWDPTQTRLTLLFDPGRIKQGVGPNLSHGAPLVAGESYRLAIAADMTSAKGTPLGQDFELTFRVGPAELRPLAPSSWQVLMPDAGSYAPLSLAFDRIMDSGAVRRLIAIHDPNGNPIKGSVETDGGGWSLIPKQPWAAGNYTITIDPELEDVSGNSVGQAFDAQVGTIGIRQEAAILKVQIGS